MIPYSQFFFQNSPVDVHNKLSLAYGKSLYFEAFVRHQKTDYPSMHNFEAGISYPGTAYKVGLKIEDNGDRDYSGSTYAVWGINDIDQIKAEYTFRKGNHPTYDYLVSVQLEAFDWEKIAISGNVDLNPENSQLKLNWSHGMKVFKLELEHADIQDGLESGIHALLKMNEVEYRGIIIYRLDEVMKLSLIHI